MSAEIRDDGCVALRIAKPPTATLTGAFLANHANATMHCTPTYSSWPNQVENWFARIQRNIITRGVFTSVKDLNKKLMRYIRQCNKDPKPLKWKYHNPSRHSRCNSSGSTE